jgi:hypothetical protein
MIPLFCVWVGVFYHQSLYSAEVTAHRQTCDRLATLEVDVVAAVSTARSTAAVTEALALELAAVREQATRAEVSNVFGELACFLLCLCAYSSELTGSSGCAWYSLSSVCRDS